MAGLTELIWKGPPKPDTSAQKAALAREQQKENELDNEAQGRALRASSSKRKGRRVLAFEDARGASTLGGV